MRYQTLVIKPSEKRFRHQKNSNFKFEKFRVILGSKFKFWNFQGNHRFLNFISISSYFLGIFISIFEKNEFVIPLRRRENVKFENSMFPKSLHSASKFLWWLLLVMLRTTKSRRKNKFKSARTFLKSQKGFFTFDLWPS